MQNRLFFLAPLFLLLIVGAQQASAMSGALLGAALDAWESVHHGIDEEERKQNEEVSYQSRTEIFPEVDSTDVSGRLSRVRDERTSEFISVLLNGSLVVFTDVPRSAWYAPYVREIAELRIVSGYRDATGRTLGLFGPQDKVTVEQMAKVMVYALGHSPDDCGQKQVLNVTSSGSWSAPFVSCAEKLQWSVYADGSVDVHRHANRAEVVATLVQAFGKQTGLHTGTGFTDVGLSTQYGSAIEQAKADGIIAGYTDAQGVPKGAFGPEDPVTRAEFAKIITLGIQIYGKKD